MSEVPAELWCAHCSNICTGLSQVGEDYLCHPFQGLDCYVLVENYDHQMPCPTCMDVRRLLDSQGVTL